MEHWVSCAWLRQRPDGRPRCNKSDPISKSTSSVVFFETARAHDHAQSHARTHTYAPTHPPTHTTYNTRHCPQPPALGALIQPHTFENRVMVCSQVTIGQRVTVGCGAIVFPGAIVEDFVRTAPQQPHGGGRSSGSPRCQVSALEPDAFLNQCCPPKGCILQYRQKKMGSKTTGGNDGGKMMGEFQFLEKTDDGRIQIFTKKW